MDTIHMPPGPQPSPWADGRGKWREGIRSSLLAAASVTSWSAVGGRPPGFTDAKSLVLTVKRDAGRSDLSGRCLKMAGCAE